MATKKSKSRKFASQLGYYLLMMAILEEPAS